MSHDNWEGDRDLDEYKGQDWKGSVFGGKHGHDGKYRGVSNYGGSSGGSSGGNYYSSGGGYSRRNASHGKRNGAIILLILGGIIGGIFFVGDIDVSSISEVIDQNLDVDVSSISEDIDENIWKTGDILTTTINSLETEHITISYDKIPQYANQNYVKNSMSDAIQQWSKNNPDMTFEIVDTRGNIHIEWKKTMYGNHAGQITGGLMEVELGSYDCIGNWNQYSIFSLSDTISHEIGHYVGLGHSQNESHLMWGISQPYPDDNFDNLEYNIPIKKSKFQSWIIYENLETNYNSLSQEYAKLDREYVKLDREYSKYPEIIYDDLQYQKAMKLYNELNELSVEINSLADQINRLSDKMNCISNQ